MRIAIAAASILAFAGTAAAATIKVPQDQPTIQAGVTAAGTGDTVSISKGVYFENVTVSVPGITIVGKGAIIDGNIAGTDGDCLTINAADVVVQGITFRNGQTQVVVGAGNLDITKCTFIDPNGDAIAGTGSDLAIVSCTFTGMSSDGVDVVGDRTSVSKSKFSRSGSRGMNLTGNDVEVVSCTFTGMDDSGAVNVTGNGAFLSKNKALYVDTDAFVVTGDGAIVESNKGDRGDGRLVAVTGDSATVRSNTATYTRGGISVSGNSAQVLSNRISNSGSTDAISVSGASFAITGNTVAVTWDDADGIAADNNGFAGGTIEGNKVSDTAGWGFNIGTVLTVTLSDDSATRCGQDNRGGVTLIGSGCTLAGVKVTDVEGPGFQVNGDANVLTSCSVKKALTDGIRVAAGAGNSFNGCSATSCGGEGFENQGTATILTGGSFTKNRIDVANDALGGATIPGGVATVNFQTGGASTQPEVD